MENRQLIIILILVIIILALGIGISFLQTGNEKQTNVETQDVDGGSVEESSDSPHTLSVVPEFDRDVKKSDGPYTVEATKWMGGSVGGFEVSLYKNGQLMDRSSYQSRAYFNDGSGWKWSNWDDGEVDGATFHKYPVSKGVEIREVEVMF